MRPLLPGLLLILWTTVLPAQAVGQQVTLDTVKEQLDRNPVLRASFQQEKTMQALSRPLLSRGRLIFAAERGVFWHIEEPVSLEMLITPDAVVERRDDGSTRRTDMAANPLFHVLARAFLYDDPLWPDSDSSMRGWGLGWGDGGPSGSRPMSPSSPPSPHPSHRSFGWGR